MNNRRKLLLALAAPIDLFAQTSGGYPTKPVHIIVAAAAGGGDDIPARHLAAKLGEILDQQVVVENKVGAGGMIGQTYVAKAPPDGYTLLLAGGWWLDGRGALCQCQHGL